MADDNHRRSPAHPGISPVLLTSMRHERAMLTQQELADKAGVSRSTVSLLETGKRNASVVTLRKLCLALQCQPGDLLEPTPIEGNDPDASTS